MKTPGVDHIPSRQVMRIKKNINKGIISGFNSKFLELKSEEMYGRRSGDLGNDMFRNNTARRTSFYPYLRVRFKIHSLPTKK